MEENKNFSKIFKEELRRNKELTFKHRDTVESLKEQTRYKDEMIAKLLKENKELKKENKQLKKTISGLERCILFKR